MRKKTSGRLARDAVFPLKWQDEEDSIYQKEKIRTGIVNGEVQINILLEAGHEEAGAEDVDGRS